MLVFDALSEISAIDPSVACITPEPYLFIGCKIGTISKGRLCGAPWGFFGAEKRVVVVLAGMPWVSTYLSHLPQF